jgi:hypothetical protein
MDNSQITTAGLTATFTVLAGLIYKVYKVVNHKRVRSSCCGKKLEASLDIENTTPPEVVVPLDNFVNNPMTKQNG